MQWMSRVWRSRSDKDYAWCPILVCFKAENERVNDWSWSGVAERKLQRSLTRNRLRLCTTYDFTSDFSVQWSSCDLLSSASELMMIYWSWIVTWVYLYAADSGADDVAGRKVFSWQASASKLAFCKLLSVLTRDIWECWLSASSDLFRRLSVPAYLPRYSLRHISFQIESVKK